MSDVTNGRPLTAGEKLVGITFNPGGSDSVNAIKQKFAEIHELIQESARSKVTQEAGLSELVFHTAYQQLLLAQMAAVKAATWQY